MAFVKFETFMDMIDRELKQKRQDNVVTVRDAARLAKQAEVAHWVNQSLGFLSSVNESFWRNIQEYTPEVDSNSVTVPFFWKKLESILIGDTTYKVGLFTDLRYMIYHKNGNVIYNRSGNFTAGTPITFVGIFRPNQLPTTGEEIDLQSFIDIDPDWINLLKLMVLIKYSSKNQLPTPLWYGQYQEELNQFKQSSPTIEAIHTWRNHILWGETF